MALQPRQAQREEVKTLKKFEFQKAGHSFSYFYDDVKELINHIVDQADDLDCSLTLIDCFQIIQELSRYEKTVKN